MHLGAEGCVVVKPFYSSLLMIVFIVDNICVPIFKFKNNSPITAYLNPKIENEYLDLNTKIDNVCIAAIIIHSCFGLIYLQRFIISTNYYF